MGRRPLPSDAPGRGGEGEEPDDGTTPDTTPDPIPLATPPLPLYRMRMGAAALTLLGANALTSPLAQLRA